MMISCASPTVQEKSQETNHEFPFFINSHNKMMIYVQINEMDSLLFVLDNGASRTCIKKEFLGQFNSDKSIIYSDSLPICSDIVMQLDVNLGSYSLSLDTIMIAPNPLYGEEQKENVIGVIGAEFFLNKITQFDFENGRVVVSNDLPDNIDEYEKYDLITIYDCDKDYLSKFRYIKIDDFQNNRGEMVTGVIFLDLGAPNNILHKAFCDSIDVHCIKNNPATFAYKFLYTSPVAVNAIMDGKIKEDPDDGIMGMAFLENYHTIFDYINNHLYLKSR